MTPPIGRARKPTQKVANATSVPIAPSSSGNETLSKTRADAVP
ncbi:hypothetical protein [Amycolatopsis sp. H20-H5]